jgi:hypothetical protein
VKKGRRMKVEVRSEDHCIPSPYFLLLTSSFTLPRA